MDTAIGICPGCFPAITGAAGLTGAALAGGLFGAGVAGGIASYNIGAMAEYAVTGTYGWSPGGMLIAAVTGGASMVAGYYLGKGLSALAGRISKALNINIRVTVRATAAEARYFEHIREAADDLIGGLRMPGTLQRIDWIDGVSVLRLGGKVFISNLPITPYANEFWVLGASSDPRGLTAGWSGL